MTERKSSHAHTHKQAHQVTKSIPQNGMQNESNTTQHKQNHTKRKATASNNAFNNYTGNIRSMSNTCGFPVLLSSSSPCPLDHNHSIVHNENQHTNQNRRMKRTHSVTISLDNNNDDELERFLLQVMAPSNNDNDQPMEHPTMHHEVNRGHVSVGAITIEDMSPTFVPDIVEDDDSRHGNDENDNDKENGSMRLTAPTTPDEQRDDKDTVGRPRKKLRRSVPLNGSTSVDTTRATVSSTRLVKAVRNYVAASQNSVPPAWRGQVKLLNVNELVNLSEKFLACRERFQVAGKPDRVQIAFHYVDNEAALRAVEADGLQPGSDTPDGVGIRTSSSPSARHHREKIGVLVAMIRGNGKVIHNRSGSVQQRNAIDPIFLDGTDNSDGNSNVDSTIRVPKTNHRRNRTHQAESVDETIVLQSCQCLPLLSFPGAMISSSKSTHAFATDTTPSEGRDDAADPSPFSSSSPSPSSSWLSSTDEQTGEGNRMILDLQEGIQKLMDDVFSQERNSSPILSCRRRPIPTPMLQQPVLCPSISTDSAENAATEEEDEHDYEQTERRNPIVNANINMDITESVTSCPDYDYCGSTIVTFSTAGASPASTGAATTTSTTSTAEASPATAGALLPEIVLPKNDVGDRLLVRLKFAWSAGLLPSARATELGISCDGSFDSQLELSHRLDNLGVPSALHCVYMTPQVLGL